jgi:hypothetical protein
MLEAENDHNLQLLKKGLKQEQSFNLDKLYQPGIFALEKTVGSNEMIKTYGVFILEFIKHIKKGKLFYILSFIIKGTKIPKPFSDKLACTESFKSLIDYLKDVSIIVGRVVTTRPQQNILTYFRKNLLQKMMLFQCQILKMKSKLFL